MKASDLIRQEVTLDEIYREIQQANDEFKYFKHCIPHFRFVSDETMLTLMKDGFKVYHGRWDSVYDNVLVIEW